MAWILATLLLARVTPPKEAGVSHRSLQSSSSEALAGDVSAQSSCSTVNGVVHCESSAGAGHPTGGHGVGPVPVGGGSSAASSSAAASSSQDHHAVTPGGPDPLGTDATCTTLMECDYGKCSSYIYGMAPDCGKSCSLTPLEDIMKDLDMDTFNAGSTQVKVSGPNCASGGAGPKMKMIELQAAR